MKIKTIDIDAKEWFDKTNGNSYFSAVVVINYQMKNEKRIEIPFEYGYGEHYVDVATKAMVKAGYLPESTLHLSYYCRDNGIICRMNKQENCRKRELYNPKKC